MANNKVVLSSGEVLIDLTADTVDAAHVIDGYSFQDKSGEPLVGLCMYDSNTADATASVSEILSTKTAYVRGTKLTGTMPNNGGVTGTISTKAGQYTIPQGYHDGSGKVSIAASEQNKLISGNIKSGVTILGVLGTYGGESVTAQSKSATPTFSTQTILPDSGYDYLSQVDISAISVVYTPNAAGGNTVTIG